MAIEASVRHSWNSRKCLSQVHTCDISISISTRSIRKQRLVNTKQFRLVHTKQREFFFVLSFVLLLAYASTMFLCLSLCRSICSQASLHSFVLPFVCPYAYTASVNQALCPARSAQIQAIWVDISRCVCWGAWASCNNLSRKCLGETFRNWGTVQPMHWHGSMMWCTSWLFT